MKKIKKIRNINGYVLIYSPNHPNRIIYGGVDGFMYEHRLKYEENIDRFLENDEHVHHLNGIKDDNRFSNLILLSNKDHGKLHGWINHNKNNNNHIRFCEYCSTVLNSQQKNIVV